jgi:hypothetical protein
MSNSITLPYSAIDSTCGAGNDYQPGSCLPQSYTSGEDRLYYFCATQSGTVQVLLNNFAPTSPGASVSLWQGCPSNGTCIASSLLFANNVVALEGNVSNTQCYFIMVDNNPGPDSCFRYSISVNYPDTIVQPSCSNMGFETGDFSGWMGSVGTVQAGAANAPHPVFQLQYYGFDPVLHSMMGSALPDDCDNLPTVNQGYFSARLGGDENSTGKTARLQQTFMVTNSNKYFYYSYAAVLQDANHLANEQPYFKVEFFDQNNIPINSLGTLLTTQPLSPGAQPGSCFSSYYFPWDTVIADLSPYLNQNVTVRFTASGCCYGGHFGYAYIDCHCDSVISNAWISGPSYICINSSATLCGPGGGSSYTWSPGGQTTQCITVNGSGNYTLSAVFGTDTVTVNHSLMSIIPPPPPIISLSNDTITCSGGFYSYHWYLDNQPYTVTNIPGLSVTNPGNYFVIAYDSAGCSQASNAVYYIPPITGNSTGCSPAGTQLCVNGGNGATYSWVPGGQTTQCIQANASGPYTVFVFVNNDTFQLSQTVTVYPTPSPPVITVSGDTLTSSAGVTYQWFHNNNYTGQTGQSIVMDSAGCYYVVITDSNGCNAASDTACKPTGIASMQHNISFSVYPNPTNGIFNVDLVGEDPKGMRLVLLDMAGREINSYEMASAHNAIDCTKLAKGMYRFRIIQNRMVIGNGKLILVN